MTVFTEQHSHLTQCLKRTTNTNLEVHDCWISRIDSEFNSYHQLVGWFKIIVRDGLVP